jgi:hypothetical protein
MTTRTALIQRIHVLKHELSLDDETYKEILGAIADGRTSCTQLGDEELNLVKIAMERMMNGRDGSKSVSRKNPKQHNRIAKLGYILNWDWRDIARFCKKQTGKSSTQKCSAADLTKVINGMVAIIDDRLAKGSLVLPHDDLALYLKYTQQHRTATQPSEGFAGKRDEPSEGLHAQLS